MRVRIGTTNHNYRNFGHGRSNMSEFERLLHLIVQSSNSLWQSGAVDYGFPCFCWRSCLGVCLHTTISTNNSQRLLAAADANWNSGVVKQKINAVDEYMKILERKDQNILNQILNPSQSAKSADDCRPIAQRH